MSVIKNFIFLLYICQFILFLSANICNDDAVPYKFAIQPNGLVEVECVKPSCFGVVVHSNGTADTFYRSQSRNDIKHESENAENFHIFVSACELITVSQSCSPNTHVLNIGYSHDNRNYLVCCDNQHTTYERESSVNMSLGQEIVGGKVIVNNQQIGFDYISDVTKAMTSNNEAVYQITTKRLYCYDANEQASTSSTQDQDLTNQQVVPNTPIRQQAAPIYSPPEQGQGSQTNFEIPSQGQSHAADFQSMVGGRARAYAPTIVQAEGNNVVIIPRRPQTGYYYPQQQQQSYYPTGGYPGGLFCFSSDTQVLTNDDEFKRMDELQVGDWIYGVNDNKELGLVKVTSWLHKLPRELAMFLKITLTDRTSLKITPEHLIYKGECDESSNLDLTPVAASKLHVGDCLYVLEKESMQFIQNEIEHIEIVEEIGIYAPLTTSENLLVNNVLASCYAVSDKLEYQTNFAKFVVSFNRLVNKIFGSTDEAILPFSSTMLMQMADLVVPLKV